METIHLLVGIIVCCFGIIIMSACSLAGYVDNIDKDPQ